jgi:predicted transcriptional regulator
MDTQDQIRTYIHTNTGIHFNEIVRKSAFATGQVQYHLHRLIDNGEIVRSEFYGQTHYYPPECDEQAQAELALLRRETAREIIISLLGTEPARPTAIVDALDIARGTLEYHLDRLVDHDVVEKTYDEQKQVHLRLENPERMAKLLSIVEPTMADQMVAGLSCLVDDLFDPPRDEE